MIENVVYQSRERSKRLDESGKQGKWRRKRHGRVEIYRKCYEGSYVRNNTHKTDGWEDQETLCKMGLETGRGKTEMGMIAQKRSFGNHSTLIFSRFL